MGSLVNLGLFPVSAKTLPVRALKIVDLPELVLPTIARVCFLLESSTLLTFDKFLFISSLS